MKSKGKIGGNFVVVGFSFFLSFFLPPRVGMPMPIEFAENM